MPPPPPPHLLSSILNCSLPLIPRYSFTRHAIRQGVIASLNTSHTHSPFKHDHDQLQNTSNIDDGLRIDNIIDTVFGDGVQPEKELVKFWEERGLNAITSSSSSPTSSEPRNSKMSNGKRLERLLLDRLEYSEITAGEHLVQVCCLIPPFPSRIITTHQH